MKKICKKCGKEFNPIYKLNKTDTKYVFSGGRRYCLECSPFGGAKAKTLMTENIKEKNCTCCQKIQPISSFYFKKNGRLTSHCKNCIAIKTLKNMQKVKQKCIEYKGGKCCICGYNRYQGALDFHHKDPQTKDLNLSYNKHSFNKVKNELDKCILVCSNCHREIHGNKLNIENYI